MVQPNPNVLVQERIQQTTCRHYWLIESPSGPVSQGVCQLCGEEREFKNYIESAPWGEDTPVPGTPAGGSYLFSDGPEEGELEEL
ncbi:MAG: hypothetical protein ACE5IG_01380 [Dehalococcoidia bacterium]